MADQDKGFGPMRKGWDHLYELSFVTNFRRYIILPVILGELGSLATGNKRDLLEKNILSFT